MAGDRRERDTAATERALHEFGSRLDELGWVRDLWAAGSWSIGDQPTAAIEHVAAPEWLIADLRSRRRCDTVASPRLRTAVIAWRDARRTVRLAR